MPGSAAAQGLGKADCAAQGKATSVLGQIFLASVVMQGGDGEDLIAAFGGQLPPHVWADVRICSTVSIHGTDQCLGR